MGASSTLGFREQVPAHYIYAAFSRRQFQSPESEVKNAVREADVQIYANRIFEPFGAGGRTSEELNGPGLLSEIAE
jgi:hypothetical protein